YTLTALLLSFLPWWGDALLGLGVFLLVIGVIAQRLRSRLFQVFAISTTSLVLYIACFGFFAIQGSVLPFIPSILAVVITGGLVVICVFYSK
ncbi:MAG: hypothetical protein HC908_04035, partial [Calothrix sp. SM1_7_51]|nr:hypothetical protein [Calothrix sp. SM1_7_51]